MVIAEALGGVNKISSKLMKVKDNSKKDKYLFKRRDEPNTSSSVPAAYLQSSSAAAVGGYVLHKRPPSVPLNPGPPTTSLQDVLIVPDADSPSTYTKVSLEKIATFHGSKEKLVVKEAALGIDRVEVGNGDRVVVKKKKVAKQPDKVGIDPLTGEKRKKKRKEIGLEAGAEQQAQKRLAAGKIRSDTSAQRDPVLKTDSGLQKDEGSGSNIELPLLLSGLKSLALDHFHVPEKVSSAVVRQMFLRFRSVVYQKSLVLSPTAEQNSTFDIPTAKSLSVKRGPLDRKRAPSDRQEEIGAKRLKNMNKIKSLSDKKPVVQKLKQTSAPPQQEKIVKKLPPKQEKIIKRSPPQQQQPKKVAAVPTMLVMKFPPNTSLPSVAELKARFARFGTLDYSSLRVFWKTSTCRVVFQHKPDAVSAYKYAVGNGSLFGNVNVRYFVREVEQVSEAAEPPARTDESDRPGLFQPVMQPPVQLKSCLKKPGEDAGPSKARVKFILSGEESPSTNPNIGREVSGSFADLPSSSSTTSTGLGLVVNSKNFQKSTVLPSLLPLPPKFHNNVIHQTPSRGPPGAEVSTRSWPAVDISQQMITLLNRCNEVVGNLTGVLGYVPYHPL